MIGFRRFALVALVAVPAVSSVYSNTAARLRVKALGHNTA